MKYGYIVLIYLAIMTVLAFALMGIDKQKAKKGAYRISEASLFVTALLGGSFGSVAGMLIFHHKTNHWYFQLFMPVIALLQFAGVLCWALIQTGWL